MIDAAHLFSISQEVQRALGMALEASEEALAADEGPGLPSIATERAYAADAAVTRSIKSLEGLSFVLRRAGHRYASQNDMDAA